MTNKTTKIPESVKIITTKDVQLLDKGPFIILSKLWKIPVEGASNKENGKDIDDKEEEGMKVEVDFFGKDCNSAGNDPQEGESVSVVPEEIRASDERSDGLHLIDEGLISEGLIIDYAIRNMLFWNFSKISRGMRESEQNFNSRKI